jgi:hypothetical protein
MPFRHTILRKFELSAVEFLERHVIPRIILHQGRLYHGKSAGSFEFSRIILRKGMPFCRKICGISKLSGNHTAERWIIHGKSKLSMNYPAESFSIPWKGKTHFSKAFQYF